MIARIVMLALVVATMAGSISWIRRADAGSAQVECLPEDERPAVRPGQPDPCDSIINDSQTRLRADGSVAPYPVSPQLRRILDKMDPIWRRSVAVARARRSFECRL
jgi:hypothetical protein